MISESLGAEEDKETPMREAPRGTSPLIWLLSPLFIVALVTSALGQGANAGAVCVSASGDLQTYAARLDRLWVREPPYWSATVLASRSAPTRRREKCSSFLSRPAISTSTGSGSSTSSPTNGVTRYSSRG